MILKYGESWLSKSSAFVFPPIATSTMLLFATPITNTAEVFFASANPVLTNVQINDGTGWVPLTSVTNQPLNSTRVVELKGDMRPDATQNNSNIEGTRYLFKNNTNLLGVNDLSFINPKGNINYCYLQMFYGCTSLIYAPVLPGGTAMDFCYISMFEGCSSLVVAPVLPATIVKYDAYGGMFKNCTSLLRAPELNGTIQDSTNYVSMFEGCTSLIYAPDLPETRAVYRIYERMFKDCTSLVNGPKIASTSAGASSVDWCGNMFEGCTSLQNLEVAFTAWPSTGSGITKIEGIQNWVKNVPTGGTFKKPASLPATYGDYFIPTGWTAINK
jgi:hypothetical protein